MKRLSILGGKTGIGEKIAALAAVDYSIKVYSRPEYNIFVGKSMMVLGRILQRTRPDVFILNASGPCVIGKEQYAHSQEAALRVLWPFVRSLDMTLVVMSAAGGWRAGEPADPQLALFRNAKNQLSKTAIELCWKKTTDTEHVARTVLFEPSTMTPSIAQAARIPCMSADEAWKTIRLGIDSRLPFVRIGGQGSDINSP